MDTPAKLLHLRSLVLERGAASLRGAEERVVFTTHGVKKGCPLLCFPFVFVFEKPLRYLSRLRVTMSAYVDDICAPARSNDNQRMAFSVHYALSLIVIQVNALKSASLPIHENRPKLPTLPKDPHPPCPLQAAGTSTTECVLAPRRCAHAVLIGKWP